MICLRGTVWASVVFDVTKSITFGTLLSIDFSDDGRTLYLGDSSDDSTKAYLLVAPYDVVNSTISTANTGYSTFSFTSQESSPTTVKVIDDGGDGKMYVAGATNAYQYSGFWGYGGTSYAIIT